MRLSKTGGAKNLQRKIGSSGQRGPSFRDFFWLTLIWLVGTVTLSADEFPVQGRYYRGQFIGARALGMGGAFVAVANDATAVYWNPAGLSQIMANQIVAVYTLDNKNEIRLSDILQPTRRLKRKQFIFLGVTSQNTGFYWKPLVNVKQKDVYSKLTSSNGDETEMWTDLEYTLNAYGLTLSDRYGSLSIGVNIKYLSGKLGIAEKRKVNGTWEEPEANISSGKGVGLDCGLMILGDHLNIGLMVSNILNRIWWEDYSSMTLEADGALGLALHMSGLTLAGDVRQKLKGESDVWYHLGLEIDPLGLGRDKGRGAEIPVFGKIFLRAGVFGKNRIDTMNPSYTVGIGYCRGPFIVDIAFVE
jgi:hypothetical protein